MRRTGARRACCSRRGGTVSSEVTCESHDGAQRSGWVGGVTKHPGQVDAIGDGCCQRGCHRVWRLVEIAIIGLVHRFPVPVCGPLCRDCETHIVERLEASAMTLCAPSSFPTTPTVAALPYSRGEPSSPSAPLSASRRSSTRCATLDMCPIQVGHEDQHVGRQHLLADPWPGVVCPHVGLYTRSDIVVDDADRRGSQPVATQRCMELRNHQVAARGFRRGLQRAVERECAQIRWVHPAPRGCG